MKIEKAVCPHCGGPIDVGTRKIINCEYCGMPIVISDLEIDKSDNNGFSNSASKIRASEYDKWSNNSIPEKQTKTASQKSNYWTPVGFRSKTNWKMWVSSTFYLVLLAVLLIPEDRPAMFSMVLWYLFGIHIVFSWRPFVDHLPGLKSGNKVIRVISKVAYLYAATMLVAFVISKTTS